MQQLRNIIDPVTKIESKKPIWENISNIMELIKLRENSMEKKKKIVETTMVPSKIKIEVKIFFCVLHYSRSYHRGNTIITENPPNCPPPSRAFFAKIRGGS